MRKVRTRDVLRVEEVEAALSPKPSAEFRLASQQVGADVWVLTLTGDCGNAAGTDLSRQLATLRGKPGPTQAVVDLSAATVIRAALCSHLIDSARAAHERGISLTVITDDVTVRERLGGAAEDGAVRVERLLATGIRDALIASMA